MKNKPIKLTQLVIVLCVILSTSFVAAVTKTVEVKNGVYKIINPNAPKNQFLKGNNRGRSETDNLRAYLKFIGLPRMAEFAEYGIMGFKPTYSYKVWYLKQLDPIKHGVVGTKMFPPNDKILNCEEVLKLFYKCGGGAEVFKKTQIIRDRLSLNDAEEKRNAELRKKRVNDEIRRARELAKISKQYWLDMFGNKEIIRNIIYFFFVVTMIITTGWIIITVINKLLDYLFIRRPELIRRTNIKFGLSRIFRWSSQLPNRDGEIILAPNLQDQKNNVVERIKLAKKNSKVGIPNVVLEGPPGVGKSATAIDIFRLANCYYVEVDGSSLLQWAPEEAIEEANKLLKTLKSLERPVYLYVDEGDVLFSSRVKSKEVAKILTPFLSQLDKTGGNVALMISTNLYSELDQAIINRVSDNYIWKFEKPTVEMATDIACNYIARETDRLELKSSLELNSRATRAKIYDAIAKRDGIVGRSIEALAEQVAINALQNNKEVTLEGVMQVFRINK